MFCFEGISTSFIFFCSYSGDEDTGGQTHEVETREVPEFSEDDVGDEGGRQADEGDGVEGEADDGVDCVEQFVGRSLRLRSVGTHQNSSVLRDGIFSSETRKVDVELLR